EEHKIERPVFDTVLIKRHGEESQRRFMVKMRVTFAEVSQLIRVSLTDRSSYEFPILIGRNFLKDYFIVDVSKNNIEKYAKPLGKEVKSEKK
ncbi:MAG: RimK/LysX family protein, partial [Sulfurovum sp.]|nr:RimK/LysX family protein [Sulfurovum sp.]